MDNDIEIVEKRVKLPSVKQASALFTIAVILFVVIGSRVQSYDLMKGVVFTEFVLIMGTALIFLRLLGYDIKKVLRLNSVGVMPFFLTFCIMLFSIPVISIVNLGNLSLIKYIFGRVVVSQPPVATNFTELLINFAIIGGSAGICEEVLFRGVIQRAYEGLGWKKGIFIAAFLFGMMHLDFQKLIGTFLLGALIGYLVYRTKSLYIGMFAHFCNNSLAVLISFGVTKLSKGAETAAKGGDLDLSSFASLTNVQLIAFIITWLFILGICISILTALIIALNMYTKRNSINESVEYRERVSYSGLVYTLPAIILIFAVYIYQGYKLSFINIPYLGDILNFLMGK